MTTRREFLGGVGAAVVVAVAGVPAIIAEPERAVIKPLPAWDVGSGDMHWRVIFAETSEEAKRIWYADTHGCEADDACDCGCGAMSFACEKYGEGLPEARRARHWDNPDNAEPTTPEMYRAGWRTCCDRCGYEQSVDDSESDVLPHSDSKREDIVVCHDCMTDDELRLVCPDHSRFDDDEIEAA